MAARKGRGGYVNPSTEIEGKLFFNKSVYHSSKASLRQAAKRFVQTTDYTDDCLYYDASFVNGRWQFEPVGLGQHF